MFNDIIKKIVGIASAGEPKITTIPAPDPYASRVYLSSHDDVTLTDVTNTVRESIEKHLPFRRTGNTILHRPESVIEFIQRFGDADSVMFVDALDQMAPGLHIVINHHRQGPEDYSLGDHARRDDTARPGDHTASYSFPISGAFKAWKKVGEKGVSQEGLGQFIEERNEDFMEPSAAMRSKDLNLIEAEWERGMVEIARRLGSRFGSFNDLKQLALHFEVHEDQRLIVKRNPTTGESVFGYENEHRQPNGEKLEVPNLFVIGIPVFEGGPLYRFPVRFAYRKEGGKVVFFLQVVNIEDVMKRAIESAVEHITFAGNAPEENPQIINVIWGKRG